MNTRFFVLLAFLVLLSCSGNNGRQELRGQVTYDGKPVPYGIIYFDPDTAQGNDGPQGAAEIRDGQYKTRADFGAVSGPHIIRITGFAAQGDAIPLFSDHEFRKDIPGDGKNIDFDVPAKKPRKS